jgi:hypothetical protein
MRKTYSLYLKIAVMLMFLQGCTLMGPAPEEAILGSWQASVGTFPIVVTYSVDNVQVGSNTPVSYSLDGNRLSYADGGSQVRLISFSGTEEMIQIDPVTDTEHRFVRLP